MFTGGWKGDCDVVGGNACWRQASQWGDDRRPMMGIFGIAGNGGICAGFRDIEVMSGSLLWEGCYIDLLERQLPNCLVSFRGPGPYKA